MTTRLLSKELVSSEYRSQLREDLSRVRILRFLVAYVSTKGVDSLDRGLLVRALIDRQSFGIASLSCSCGHEPLLDLQRSLGKAVGVRLKYFMDPLVSDSDGPRDLTLFHSKLIYLLLPEEQKSVIYIGSHNWTERAIGPYGPRNAEASVRLEFEFSEEHLEGVGQSIPSQVNRHLLDAYEMPLCLPATSDNEPRFIEWNEKGCKRSPAPMDQITVLLAVLKPGGDSQNSAQWQRLADHGIYMQALDEAEGKILWRTTGLVFVLVWESDAALNVAAQPYILVCRITTKNAGRSSELRGTNQSPSPIIGFEGIIFDEVELANLRGLRTRRLPVELWSGREVSVYDFEFPTSRHDSRLVDGSVEPKYQYHLEVDEIVCPADRDSPIVGQMLWTRESFAVAESKKAAPLTLAPGFCVEHDLRDAMMKCLQAVLRIDPQIAKVLPVCDVDSNKLGRRLSSHPLHETYIGPEWKNRHDQFYRHTIRGSVVAELDDSDDRRKRDRKESLFGESLEEPLSRTLRVFTTPLDQLRATWHRFAVDRHRDGHGPDQHEVGGQEPDKAERNRRHDMPE